MKAKSVWIIFSILVVATVAFLFVRSRALRKPQKDEVYQFLVLFNVKVQAGNTDSLLNCFEVSQKSAVLNRLITVLSNKTGFKGNGSPLFKLALDIDHAEIKILNGELAQASVPVKFTSDSLGAKMSVLKLKVYKISAQTYKIVQIDAKKMMADYIAYDNAIKSKTLTDKDIYSPLTLRAFETANQLKAKYDSVIWFAHDGNNTYYYVVKGKWDDDLDSYRRKGDTAVSSWKMGLVGPDLKEILPVEFDLIHNISGIFPGLIEVEKDGKKGLFDLQGKIALPVIYDQVFPINDDANLAVLRKGDDYFYLKKDMTVSGKSDLKVADFFQRIRLINGPVNLAEVVTPIITEYNSRERQGTVYITPSYLVDLNMAGKIETFKNPLRKLDFEEVHTNYDIGSPDEVKDSHNWFTASVYSIRDYFVGGRYEFYDSKNIVIIDQKKNRIFSQPIADDYTREEDGGGSLEGQCNVNAIRAINDSLYEVKAGAILNFDLYDSTKSVTGGPYYHYLVIRNNTLTEQPDDRYFGFTKYVKMDDSYLNACYNLVDGQ
jgi:hypothetical protein